MTFYIEIYDELGGDMLPELFADEEAAAEMAEDWIRERQINSGNSGLNPTDITVNGDYMSFSDDDGVVSAKIVET